MKILHVGDIAFVASTLSREMNRRGHEARVFSKKKGVLAPKTNQSVKTAKNFLDEFNLGGFRPGDFDIVHGHYLINWGSLGLRFKNTQTPVILHCHGSDTRPKNYVEKILQRFVAGENKFLLYSTPDLLKNVKWFKGQSIYLPNPVGHFIKRTEDDVYSSRVLIYGTLYRLKQTEKLMGLVEKSSLNFDMIDLGPDRRFFKKIAPKNLNFITPVLHDDVPRLLSRYPLVIGASQDGTIRLCELEAMSLGIPTLFPFQYNEFYDEPLTMPEGWPDNFERYIGDSFLGERQRQWVELYHGTPVVADRLVKIYQQVMANEK